MGREGVLYFSKALGGDGTQGSRWSLGHRFRGGDPRISSQLISWHKRQSKE